MHGPYRSLYVKNSADARNLRKFLRYLMIIKFGIFRKYLILITKNKEFIKNRKLKADYQV